MATLRAEAGVSGGIAPGAVSADSLAQEVTLVTNNIKSADYVPGVLGWNISGTGVAEFSNIYVRGDINAETGTIGYWNISSPGVERTIGGRQLFGTFLESADFGASDDDVDSGVYVGLFKSYFEGSVPVAGATRLNNVVTITSPSHGYLNGDFVIVDIDNDSTNMYGSGSSPVRIIEVSKDTFKYQNSGTDTVYVDGSSNFIDHNVTGTATLYVKDVAGLYLQDYGKALFDYGYFSNEGVAYVSAETPNLVYNASFEYVNSSNITVFSNASWMSTLSLTSYGFATEDIYNGDSTYAAKVVWDGTASSTYIHAKTNSSEFKRLDFYKNDRELYLNFDIFFTQTPNKIAIPTTNSFVTTSNTVVTITCAGHGLAVNDLVYLDFNAFLSPPPGGTNFINYGRIHTVLSVSGDSFTILNKAYTTSAGPVTLTAYASDIPYIFKFTQPVFDLGDIKISFVTDNTNPASPVLDSTTSLYDVLTDVSASSWNNDRYWSHATSELDDWYYFYGAGEDNGFGPSTYRLISKMGVLDLEILLDNAGVVMKVLNIKLSSSKIEKFYRKIANLQYANDVEFFISFPAWVWEGTYSNMQTAVTKRNVKATNPAGMGYILDNVSLSPEKKFFFGDSGSSAFYYKLTDADSSKTDKVSYETPRQWLDIDLDFQTAELRYMDSIEFKSADFLKQLFINPGINTVKSFRSVFAGVQERLYVGEASVLNITSGQYKYLDANAEYRSVDATYTLETGVASAVHQLKALSSADPNMNSVSTNAGGLFTVGVTSEDKGSIAGYADNVSFRSFGALGNTILDSVDGAGGISTFILYANGAVSLSGSKAGNTYLSINTDGIGFKQGSRFALGVVTYENEPGIIEAVGVLDNQLVSNYQTVYIHNVNKTLGYVSSSITTKKNVEPLQLNIDSILAAEPVQFNYKSEEDGSAKHAGFIAEQLVEAGLSGYVSMDSDGNPVTVNYDRFVSALQSVVRHQAAQLANLTSRLEALEDK
jgi:hypothetical protein